MKQSAPPEDAPASPLRGLSLSAWSVVAAFGVYFCTYGLRKPFTAATYADESLGGVDYKTILVTAQVLGYTLAKFLGIKVVAEAGPRRRVILLLALIGGAQVSLLLFGLTPAPVNFVWLFGNGLALGMVFGLVLGFLEGRRHTELLAAGLCTSFIVADGVTKAVGASLLAAGVPTYWMPFAAGLVFAPPLLLFTWMLAHIPGPSRQDVAARSRRAPMSGGERWHFFRRYAPGLTLLVLMFLLVTVLRSVRADFAPEIWKDLQAKVEPDVFARSEMVVAAGVLLLNGSVVLIRDNRRALSAALALAVGGALLIAASLLGLRAGALSPFAFMVLHGLGLYLPYIAVHVTIFERLIAVTRDRGNVGFLMQLADAFGYSGYVGVLFAHSFLGSAENFLSFFVLLSWVVAGACVLLLIPCWYFFAALPATRPAPLAGPVPGEEAAAERIL
jgi:hypothetical protein